MTQIDEPMSAPEPESALRANALGASGIAFMVVAAAAPLTVMAGVAPLALAVGGVGAPVAYLGAGAVFAVFAVGFLAMTRHVGGVGAFYSYITLGLGKALGLAAGILAVLSYNAVMIGVYGLMAVQTQAAIERLLHVHIEWWVLALAAIVVVLAIGRRGVDVGAKILGVLLVFETAILLVLAFSVLVQGGADGIEFSSFTPDAIISPGMGGILAIAFAAFMGFESTAVYRSEARDPNRTIPRATYCAVGFMALFYCFIVWSIVQAFGDRDVQAAAGGDIAGLFFTAIEKYVGLWASDVMSVLIVTSALASQIAFHNAINRYTLSLANDGILPRWLDHTHPVFKSPSRAGLLQTVVAAVVVSAFALAGADPYYKLLLLLNTPGIIGLLVLQLLTSIAVVAYFVRKKAVSAERIGVIAAAIGAVLLAGGTALLIKNVELLTLATGITNVLLVGSVGVVILAGVAAGMWCRSHRPDVYAAIGGFGAQHEAITTTPHERESQI
ncbi:APC family permease [Rhodococcus sp. G-MC3]|uniref:APC family permease n=1 Tax=Rhodococcus sp. G-MC3 TaxID=3046209 RepID=UPI0024BB2525|nr:APC family permease [Rhodococcus sp. G-MC3]MDJ0395814.1 APC family permease [Rhodococcus sp. G-MC3]